MLHCSIWPGVLRRSDAAPVLVTWIGKTDMNAHATKDHFEFSLGNLSYIGPSYEEPQTERVNPASGSSKSWFGRLTSAIGEWRQRHAVLQEMQTMTDRELSDIGLSRADLGRVFDPAFATDYSRGRNYGAY
jgi:uncharacterized protein YjiS (DUF1127 family)